MKIFLDLVGCRLNQSEIEGFANLFRALGHEIISGPEGADIAIVNTCAVTVKAAADSRKKLRRASRHGAQAVVATGCWATIEPDVARNLPGVTRVILNAEKDNLVADLLNMPPDEISALQYRREPLPGDRGRTRAFIKVQEGCDNHCTYCLTRLARGASRSITLPEIQKDIQAALDGGAKEIVLTGVQLGAWGRDFAQPRKLRELLANILLNHHIKRVRLSSIEPWEFDLSMLSLWKDRRLCRHLHLPLQSGSDRILRRMGRPISLKAYQVLLEEVRDLIPDIAITTDVITGFPGEGESDFEATKTFIQRIGFAGGHVFTYSPRERTAAFRMDGQVSPVVAKARNAALREVFELSQERYQAGFIGRLMPVLWESSVKTENGHWQLSGLTDNYIRVYAQAEEDLWNTVTPTRLDAVHPKRNGKFGLIDQKATGQG